jgi:hypothetical protein
MRKMIKLFVVLGMVLMFLGCETLNTGGGRVQSCGISPRYCAPGP